MNFQAIINSSFGVRLGMGIARLFHPRVGFRVADFLADRISGRTNLAMVKAVRANQWVVAGGQLSPVELQIRTRQVFRNVARSLYVVHRTENAPEERQSLIEPNTNLDEFIALRRSIETPLVLVGTHQGNFDLLLTSAGWQGLKMIALGWHQPGSGYQLQNAQRNKYRVQVLPASLSTIRFAQRYLKEGGMVVTGCDRPVLDSKYHPRFFGRSASLNVVYTQLALSCNAPVIVAGSTVLPNGQVRLLYSQPIMMRAYSDRQTELLRNTETILEAAADIIRQSPTEWAMFYPVWPEAIDEVANVGSLRFSRTERFSRTGRLSGNKRNRSSER